MNIIWSLGSALKEDIESKFKSISIDLVGDDFRSLIFALKAISEDRETRKKWLYSVAVVQILILDSNTKEVIENVQIPTSDFEHYIEEGISVFAEKYLNIDKSEIKRYLFEMKLESIETLVHDMEVVRRRTVNALFSLMLEEEGYRGSYFVIFDLDILATTHKERITKVYDYLKDRNLLYNKQ